MSKMNILLITTDQQRYDTVRACGFEHMVTPNLDALAEDGCIYPNACSPNPVCMAARHNILTGLTARFHGFDDNYFEDNPRVIPYDLPTLPQLLSDGGYDTAAIGKMHFQPCRRHNGFTKMELMEEIPRYREDDEYAVYLKEQGFGDIGSIHGVRHLLYMLPQRSLVDEKHHGSTWVADRTIAYLKENGGRRPFFLWSSFIAPHPPFDVPEGWADLYRGKDLPPLKKTRTPVSELAEENKGIADYPDEQYLLRARELYLASISFVDYQVGRILRQLKEMGIYENTLILFTSDHGEMLGDYGTFQKFLPYDSSVKIPMILRCPGRICPGSEDRRFADLNDILPTCLDAADISYPNPEILPGESLLEKDGFKDRQTQYVEYGHGNRRWISMRDQRYKYNYYFGGGKEELFDMKCDPDESENLLYGGELDPVYAEVRDRLHSRLTQIEARYGLKGYVKRGELAVFEEYKRCFYRENNPPMFPGKEKGKYMSLEEEVRKAVENEPVVKLEELDLNYYTEKGTLKKEDIRGGKQDESSRL